MFSNSMSILLQRAGDGEPRYIIALVCVVVASILALAVNIALAYRIRKLAPPPDESSQQTVQAIQTKEAERRDHRP